MSIRNCVTRLSAAQRNAYVRGVKALMTSGRYQWYVTTHSDAQSMNFHETPWFLPWHRQFLRIYEADLRTALGDPSFALPYWDSVGDWANAMSTSFTPLSDAQASIVANAASVWCDDLMGHSHGGPDGDDVTSGPFANTATTTPAGLLRRGYGMPPTASSTALPTRAALGQVLTETVYDAKDWNSNAPQGFRNALEVDIHNVVHRWVGGSMLPLSSPNDPVFFLHHCNIDRLWAQWQDANPAAGYLPPTGTGTPWDAGTPMWPWDGTHDPSIVKPEQMWDYRSLGYEFGAPWTGPAFSGVSTSMQPVESDPTSWQTAWASQLIGTPGWTVFSGGENRPVFQPARQSIVCTGQWGLSLQGAAPAVGTHTLYLCLRGSGARYQHPVIDADSSSRRWFDGWNGSTWVPGNNQPVAAPIGLNGDCWFRLTPGSYGSKLAVQDDFVGDNNFEVWGFIG